MSDQRLMETRLGEHYAEHLTILDQRLRSALEASGLDGLIVLAGHERAGCPCGPSPLSRHARVGPSARIGEVGRIERPISHF